MFAGAEIVYDLREEFFAGAALARYEHRQVDRRNPYGPLHGCRQRRGVTYYAEALLGLQHLGGGCGEYIGVWHCQMSFKEQKYE